MGTPMGNTKRRVDEIRRLIEHEHLTKSQVAQRLKMSQVAVKKALRKSRKISRGVPPPGYPPFIKVHSESDNHTSMGDFIHTSKGEKRIRLHGEQWVAKILYKFPRYEKVRLKQSVVFVGGFRVIFNKRNVEFYSQVFFWGQDVNEATQLSLDAFQRALVLVENDAGVSLVKDRYFSIRRVKAHYAEVQNEVAKDAGDKKIKVFAREDGKLAFLVDNSFNLNELEGVHPATSKEDADAAVRFLDDLRTNDPPLPSELAGYITSLARIQDIEVRKLGGYAQAITEHISAIKKLGVSVEELSVVVRNLGGFRKPQGVVDRLFADPDLLKWFHGASKKEQNIFLGLVPK